METATTSHAWEQQPGESGPAFAAFRAFRDMGPGRSAVRAYGQLTGNEGAMQKPGRWNSWAGEHRWAERARAYDRHLEAIRLHEADEAAAERAHLWAVRGEEQLERDWRAAEGLSRRVEMLLELPIIDVTTQADGKTTVVEAIRIRDVKVLAEVATVASRLAWSAIDAAAEMYGPDVDFDPATATTEELDAMIALLDRRRRRPARLDAGGHSLARPS